MANILFLDLDGTVRRTKTGATFINDPYDQELIPGVKEAIARHQDWVVVGISNQGGVGSGFKTFKNCLEEQTRTMELLPQIQNINFCTGMNGTGGFRCYPNGGVVILPSSKNYRKPSPDMILQFLEDFAEKNNTYLMVGDRPEDQECAKNAGIDFMWAETWRLGA